MALLMAMHAAPLRAQSSMRLATYNLRALRGLDDILDEERTVQILKSLGAEAIAVQEIDSCTQRTNKVDQLELLGRKLGMHYNYIKNIDFQGGGYGVGLLSKEKPLSVKRIPLPGKEARGVIICEFEKYVYACTHLCVNVKENRLKSMEIIRQEAAKYNKPFFLAGDMNAKPGSPAIEMMQQSMTILNSQEPTYPAVNPNICIDYIATNCPDVKVYHTEVIKDTGASDHCPVVVDFTAPWLTNRK